ncbi:MAG: HAMP domain-containing histidine kinase [Rhodoferax sp.]|nr:HAMP domain-containing histidine kinase [Rhodoferax sp.]
MHATLAEILENFKSGLLWVQKDGGVRYANADAAAMTGLAPGRKLYDPDLLRAVAQAVGGQTVSQLSTPAARTAPGRAGGELQCRVLPGLSRDDAFVLLSNGASEQGAAFDNLLAVVRTDLRDPLRQAHDALRGDAPPADGVAQAVTDVLDVLDKLVDLADLWASDALLDSDRIEPWPLLQQVWRQVAPLASHRSITVRFDANDKAAGELATIYGSEVWLERVFRECLEQAVRAARPGDTLDIDYRQLGPRALIVFRDCGAFAGASAGAVELGRDKTAPVQRPDASAQIGFKLCQHIVALHGGRLREEMEDGLRNFLIDLPTGAPHRNDAAQLDIAQAQHYARDLAALMARARKARPAS